MIKITPLTTIKTILVDDEKEALDSLEILLAEYQQIRVVKTISNPLDLFPALINDQPELIFLDIQMPQINGLELLVKIKECCPKMPIVFITAFDNFALDAAKNNAFSYLLKPVDREELSEVIKKIVVYHESIHENQSGKIAIVSKYETVLVDPDDVAFLKADGNYTLIRLDSNKEILASSNLGTIITRFPLDQFIRINRSMYVNKNKLISINRKRKTCKVLLKNEVGEFSVSNSFLKEFKNIFNNA